MTAPVCCLDTRVCACLDDRPADPVDPRLVLAALTLCMLLLGVLAVMDQRCQTWADGDPQRVADCQELRR